MDQQEATTIDLTADDEPVAIDSVSHTQDGRGAPPPPPAGMPPMPPLRRSENSESDSSLPDFAAASSESESEGEEAAAASLEAALRRLTPRMPPLRRSASSASDSSLPVAIRCIRSGRVDGVSRHSFVFTQDLASASSSASEAESEGSFDLVAFARSRAGSAAFWAGVDNWRRESGITEPRSPEEVPLPRPVPFSLWRWLPRHASAPTLAIRSSESHTTCQREEVSEIAGGRNHARHERARGQRAGLEPP